MSASDETEAGPVESVTAFLEQRGIDYELVTHDESFSAAGEAKAAGIEPQNAAKSILLKEADSYRLAVIPASERLDLHKVRDLLDGSSHLRLATEDEMRADFAEFELGAIPPIGPMLPAPEIVDSRVLKHDQVLCNAGDHRHSLQLDPQQLVRACEARVADICEDGGRT
jgi:Ala-tRNA(Pro) deacylase